MPAQECLLVKTGPEIALKSSFVRRFFTKKLVKSVRFALKKNRIECSSIAKGGGRLYVFCPNRKKAQKVLSTISGMHATALALHFEKADYWEIETQTVDFAKRFLKKGNSFALDVNAAANPAFSARGLEFSLGAAIQKAIAGLKVNLKSPEKEIFLEIRKSDFFIYSSDQRCLGGLPIGVEGSVALLFSGKKDELIAAFLLMHRGCNVFPVVRKATPALKKSIQPVVKFNDFRQFILTEEKDFPKLLEERKIQAIATADSKIDGKSLVAYKKFDAAQQFLVLRPLLLYPEEKKKALLALFP